MLQAWILSVVFDVNASDAVVSSTSDDSYLSVQSNTAVVLLSSHNDYFEEALLTVTKRKFFAKARKWKKGKKMEVETSIFKANRRKKSHPPPPSHRGAHHHHFIFKQSVWRQVDLLSSLGLHSNKNR